MILPDHAWHWRHLAWRAYVERLRRSDLPILVGPFRGEVGFETLYWIPFVEHLCATYGIAKSRIVPISRGGASSWYGTPTGLELYAMRTPQQLRVANREQVARTGMFKQTVVEPFDRAVLADAAETLGCSRYHVLHPAWMYICLAPFWTMTRGLEWLNRQVQFQRLTPPDLAESLPLPTEFVAVRFYARSTFPANVKGTHEFLRATVGTIVQQSEVVILDSDLSLDDHRDMTMDITGPRIHHLSDYVPLSAETNLAMMSAVLAKARGFVGTYGGFAQLALRCGVPSVSFYTDWQNTSVAHKHLADVIATRSGVPAHVMRMGDVPMLNAILPETSLRTGAPA